MQATQQTLFSVPSIKSPLQYVGGKSRVTSLLYSYFPSGITEVVSPFLGGGSLELYLAAQGIRVHAYDNFPPLVNFWQHMLTKPSAVVEGISQYMPPHKYYRELYDTFFDIDCPLEQAVAYWLINRVSFSGKTLSWRGAGRGKNNIHYFNKFRNFNSPIAVFCRDFRDSLSMHPNIFAYCDPPYVGREFYYGDGTRYKFPHEELAEILRHRSGDFMLSYNDDPLVRDLYPEGEFSIKYPKWTYGLSGGSSPSNELLIMRKPCK